MKLTLVRHCEVEREYLGCYNGHIDIGLSEQGKHDAKLLAEHFNDTAFDTLYCSDLLRARMTLAPFAQKSAAQYSEALREKSWGRHEGMEYAEISKQEGLAFTHFEQWVNALDGEPCDVFVERVRHFFLEELAAKPYEEVLVMTHAGVIRTLYAITQNMGLEAAFSLPLPYGAYRVYDLKTNRFGEVQCVCS